MRHNKHSAYVYACDLQFMVDGSVWGFFLLLLMAGRRQTVGGLMHSRTLTERLQ